MIFQDWNTTNFNFSLPLSYKLFGRSNFGTAILFHGFQDHALSMLKRLHWQESELPFQVLAINGPFPVPVRSAEGLREAFAWYFRDLDRGVTLVPPEHTAERISQLLEQLKICHQPCVLVGFSQGGYLAPYVGQQIQNLRGIVGIGCGYRHEAYHGLEKIKVHAIHGDEDSVIPLAKARDEHQILLDHGFEGMLHAVEGLEHRIDFRIEPLLRSLVEGMLR